MGTKTAISDGRNAKGSVSPPAISYRLSDEYFLDIGWTCGPNVSSTIPFAVMKAKFSNTPISPWFKRRCSVLKKKYPNGNTVFVANSNGTGEIYYPNGKLAVKIDKGGMNRTKIWVYSSGEVDLNGEKHPPQLCGLFDSLGNGVVYDSRLEKRLVYNQTEGMLWDAPGGVPVLWRWHAIQFSDSLSIMNEEEEIHKKESKKLLKFNEVKSCSDLLISTDSEFEFQEYLEQSRYLNTEKLWPKRVSPVKPIVLRINQHLALRILSQSEIFLNFFTETHQTTLKIGVLYNPFDKLKVVEIENLSKPEKVICGFEDLPPVTSSMLNLRKILENIRGATY